LFLGDGRRLGITLIYAFENYLLDAERRELRRGSDLVAVEPGVFDLLQYLICNRERVVSKDDLMAAVWPGTHVSDATLAQNVFAIRRALGDAAIVDTVPKFGYRLATPVERRRRRTVRVGPVARRSR
jgi:DNA-binding winged helix-turn-helix (wHTH) protein